MAYSTIDDIMALIPEQELVQLTDDTGAGVVDLPLVERAIADADAEIDAYLAGRYPVPLAPAPDIIRRLSAELAGHLLYARRVPVIPDSWRDRRSQAQRLLENISRGVVSLGGSAAAPAATGTAAVVLCPERLFGRQTP